MKIVPKDMQEACNKLSEKFQNGACKTRFADILSRNQEVVIAAVAGLIMGVIITFSFMMR